MANGNNEGPRIITGPGGVASSGLGLHPDFIKAILSGKTPRATIDIAIDEACVEKVSAQLSKLQEQADGVLATMERAIAKAKELAEVGKDAVYTEKAAGMA